jgi:molybdopterin biosynthesis enzyme
MASRYEEVFGELEEACPLPGERLARLPEALRILATHAGRVEAELHPVDGELAGRVLTEPVSLALDEGQPPVVLPPGLILTPLHVSLLAHGGLEGAPVRRQVRVCLLAVAGAAGEDLDGPLLQLSAELSSWPAEVRSLGAADPESASLLEVLAEGVVSDLCVIACSEPARPVLREAARNLGARTLFDGLLCSPGRPTFAMSRHGCLLLAFPTEPGTAFLMHQLVLGSSLASFLGIPPATTQELPAESDLPSTDREALLVPCVHVRSRLGPAARPLGVPGEPAAGDLVEATGVIYLPPHSLPRERGDLVRVLPISARRPGPPLGPSQGEEARR